MYLGLVNASKGWPKVSEAHAPTTEVGSDGDEEKELMLV